MTPFNWHSWAHARMGRVGVGMTRARLMAIWQRGRMLGTLAAAQSRGLTFTCRSCGARSTLRGGRLRCSRDRQHMDPEGRVERAREELASMRRIAELKRLVSGADAGYRP